MPRSLRVFPPLHLAVIALLAACGNNGSTSSTSPPNGDAGGGGVADAGATGDGGGADGGDAAIASDDGGAGVECDYAYSAYNSSPSVQKTSTSAWSCTSTTRKVVANGIPDHPTGTFPNANNPNTIAEQSVSQTMPLVGVSTGTAAAIGIVGYAFNGVKFDPSTAGTCGVDDAGTTCTLLGSDGTWTIEALGQTSFDFGVDSNNAHVQPNGAYHYHGMPEGILTRMGKGAAPTLVGFALDGFPVYARYGYTDPMDATSAVKVMTSSYGLKSTPDPGRPSTETYPMGAFTQDYVYTAGSGDLDECNGRTDVTPEYPKGLYHYYITDTYPFIQRCVKGTATSSGQGPLGDGGGPPPMGGDGGMGPPPGGP